MSSEIKADHFCENCKKLVVAEGNKPPRCPECGREIESRQEAYNKHLRELILAILQILGIIGSMMVTWYLLFT